MMGLWESRRYACATEHVVLWLEMQLDWATINPVNRAREHPEKGKARRSSELGRIGLILFSEKTRIVLFFFFFFFFFLKKKYEQMETKQKK
jgi:hypothetical protein